MRTHLINTIAHADDPAPVTDMGGPLRTRELKVRTARKDVNQRTTPRRTPKHHIVARDCVPDLHWEKKRNDQCEACDKGGTLTEYTRCNIV